MRRRIVIRCGAELPPREAESKACRARLLRDRLVAWLFLVLFLFHQHQLANEWRMSGKLAVLERRSEGRADLGMAQAKCHCRFEITKLGATVVARALISVS